MSQSQKSPLDSPSQQFGSQLSQCSPQPMTQDSHPALVECNLQNYLHQKEQHEEDPEHKKAFDEEEERLCQIVNGMFDGY